MTDERCIICGIKMEGMKEQTVTVFTQTESYNSRAVEHDGELFLQHSPRPLSCGDSIEFKGARRNVDMVFIEPNGLRVVLGRSIG